MIALASLNDLKKTQAAFFEVKKKDPELYEAMIHLISLTRQLQFRYHYMVSLLTGEDAHMYSPKHARKSVVNLYLKEVTAFKAMANITMVKQLFLIHKCCGYDHICQLLLGRTPEELKGVSSRI